MSHQPKRTQQGTSTHTNTIVNFERSRCRYVVHTHDDTCPDESRHQIYQSKLISFSTSGGEGSVDVFCPSLCLRRLAISLSRPSASLDQSTTNFPRIAAFNGG